MKMFHAGAAVLLCGTLASCATNPLTSTTTMARPSIGDFTDHVLEPLALRVADEKVIEASAALKLARAPKVRCKPSPPFCMKFPGWKAAEL